MAELMARQYRINGAGFDLIADLDYGYDMGFQMQLSEPGSGSVTLPLDTMQRVISDGVTTITDTEVTSATALFSSNDLGLPVTGPGIPAAAIIVIVNSPTSVEISAAATASATDLLLGIGYDLQPNDIIMWLIDDVPTGFASLVEKLEDHTLDAGEGSREYTRIEGRGVGACLEWAIIGPANGFDAEPVEADRLFSWPAIQYVEGNDGQPWDEVVDAGDAHTIVRVPGLQEGYPDGAPDLALAPTFFDPKWIWADPGTQSDAPNGRVYARTEITLAFDSDVIFLFALDNWGQGFLDGGDLFTLDASGGAQNYLKVHTVNRRLTAGTHTVAVTAVNSPNLSTNPGGIFIAIGEVGDDGNFGTVINFTNVTDWNVLGYPTTVPGMNPGEAVGIAMDEAQTRSALVFVDRLFDDDVDGYETPWPIYGDIATKTATDALTFLQELSVAYLDWVMTFDGSAMTLALYVKDDYTQVGGGAVLLTPAPVNDPATGNLLQLDRTRT